MFSFKGGRFFWKLPLSIPYPVTVAFGAPMPSTTSAAEARLALQSLGSDVAPTSTSLELNWYTWPMASTFARILRLCQTELPRLWLPKREDLQMVEAIPTLGTGKVDLRAVRQLATERAATIINQR